MRKKKQKKNENQVNLNSGPKFKPGLLNASWMQQSTEQ